MVIRSFYRYLEMQKKVTPKEKSKGLKLLSPCSMGFCAAYLSYLCSTHGLKSSHYTVASHKLTGSFRVVSLADLHGHSFGKDNVRLIRLVQKETPDLILMPGDLLDKKASKTDGTESLIPELSRLALVYLSPGNHEGEYDRKHSTKRESILQRLREAGAHILDRSYEEILVKGQKIRIGGFFGYAVPEKVFKNPQSKKLLFLKDFQDTDHFKMLLCHMPHPFLTRESLEHWQFDTVLSGHVHGGQVRFPFFGLLSRYKVGKDSDRFPYWGGLWAPDQGLFPGRLTGVYYSKDKQRTMILSRGLGNTEWIP